MKFLSLLLSVLVCSAPLHAAQSGADVNGELMAALRGINGRVSRTTTLDAVKTLGWTVGITSAAFVGVFAMGLRVAKLPPQYAQAGVQGMVLEKLSANMNHGVNIGATTLLGAYLYQGVRWATRRGGTVDYRTSEGLAKFFLLSIDRQYAIARPDPLFTKFLINLNASFQEIDHGFTGQTVTP